jgi:hypothetical protein
MLQWAALLERNGNSAQAQILRERADRRKFVFGGSVES